VFETVITGLIAILIGLALGALVGWLIRKNTAEKGIGSAEEEAKRIVENAYSAAESKKRESVIAAKEEVMLIHSELEKETRERRNELQRLERRLLQKEESLDRKIESLERKE